MELSGYELARVKALRKFIPAMCDSHSMRTVLDYGAGRGAFAFLWKELFPNAELHFSDVSPVGLKKLEADSPEYAGRTHLVQDSRADVPNEAFDAVVSIEVMEHVDSLPLFLLDIARVLRPGGIFIWTTPCANALSIEHLHALATDNIEQGPAGFRRWKWEDRAHVRRLKTRELTPILRASGFEAIQYRFRAHVFSFLCSQVPALTGKFFSDCLMALDYDLFRMLPNGASMIGIARKSGPGHAPDSHGCATCGSPS